MARDDWFRRTTWSFTDHQDFHARLKRSRTQGNKAQYVRIQAGYLADAGLHEAAIELLDLLFRQYPERFQLAQAHLQKALCLVELGKFDSAIIEFRSSLQAQRDMPNVGTTCWLTFPLFIVRNELVDHYDEALSVLEEFRNDSRNVSRLVFPIERYHYWAVLALIAKENDDIESAEKFAKNAIENASLQHSGFRYHPDVGVVTNPDSIVQDRLIKLATGSG